MPKLSSLDRLDRSTSMGRCLHEWHRVLEGDRSAFDTLVADDAVRQAKLLLLVALGRFPK